MASECIVVNSNVVIALAKIKLLNTIVNLYEEDSPKAVYKEVVVIRDTRLD